MKKSETIEQLFKELIDKMKQQVNSPKNQSFGSLAHHLKEIEDVLKQKKFLSPLYFVQLPRWMGEYGNTELEEEIYTLAIKIDILVIELAGGTDIVNKIRDEHNKKLTNKQK